jgi:tRNA 2-selenouridine synthase
LLDVRSTGEYEKGHIPGAGSFPLFTDEERKNVGIIYKSKGRKSAIRKGFEIVGGKYCEYLKKIKSFSPDVPVFLYCWRGGMRSAALGWLFEKYGFTVYLLKGGYKSFRSQLREDFARERKICILGGMTGSGKTEILWELKKAGQQVIDLEDIAGHRGSAFGNLGFREQISNEHFENRLWDAFRQTDPGTAVWLENESRSIGRVIIPPELYSVMQRSDLYLLEVPRKIRIERIVEDYSHFPSDQLVDSIYRIRKKLGGLRTRQAVDSVVSGDYRKAVDLILDYYDKSYRYCLEQKDFRTIRILSTQSANVDVNAAMLLEAMEKSDTEANPDIY